MLFRSTEPGKESPYRNRTVEENMKLFEEMKSGKYNDGEKVLRAKIDMASPNINMRDPVIYRIKKVAHHRTGDTWCIYPMYDFTHCISDALEYITHSICTLEFEDHRPLYDWILDNISVPCHPQQIEFARLNITSTVMSKRKLLKLVNEKYVNGWDDPRMWTISGLRRRGYTPESIRRFAEAVGVAKANSIVDYAMLEHFVREHLNETAQRVMVVIDPIKVVITNYPEDKVEWIEAENNPQDTSAGTRKLPFTRELYIDREDFMENPPKKYFRLFPGSEVRLKHTYYITCTDVIKDAEGNIIELHCTYDPQSQGGSTPDGRKVRGTLHWVSAAHAVSIETRMYEHLFTKEDPEDVENGKDFTSNINPDSLKIYTNSKAEPSLRDADAAMRFQFLRQGYFFRDPDSTDAKLVYNRIVGLKDSWAKVAEN